MGIDITRLNKIIDFLSEEIKINEQFCKTSTCKKDSDYHYEKTLFLNDIKTIINREIEIKSVANKAVNAYFESGEKSFDYSEIQKAIRKGIKFN